MFFSTTGSCYCGNLVFLFFGCLSWREAQAGTRTISQHSAFPECHFCIYLLLVRVAVLHLQLHNTPNVIPFSLLRGKLCPSCASAGNTWAAKSMALQRRTRGAIPWPQFQPWCYINIMFKIFPIGGKDPVISYKICISYMTYGAIVRFNEWLALRRFLLARWCCCWSETNKLDKKKTGGVCIIWRERGGVCVCVHKKRRNLSLEVLQGYYEQIVKLWIFN